MRSRAEVALDARFRVEEIMDSPRTTDTEYMYMTLSLMGYTDTEICRRQAWGHNRCQTIKNQIRRKHE